MKATTESQIAYTKAVLAAEKRHEERCRAAAEEEIPTRNAMILESRAILRREQSEAEKLLVPLDIYSIWPWPTR